MATSFDSTVTNAVGISKVILFKGLSHPVVLTPSILGEPVFTAQPFYFLNDLDCIIRIRFENRVNMPDFETNEELEDFIETLIDNYLFEYSKKYPSSKITSKVTIFSYWKDELDNPYFRSDKMNIDDGACDLISKAHGTHRRLSYGAASCPWRIKYEGALYHVFSRGNNQQNIF